MRSVRDTLGLVSRFFTGVFPPCYLHALVITAVRQCSMRGIGVVITRRRHISIGRTVFGLTIRLCAAVLYFRLLVVGKRRFTSANLFIEGPNASGRVKSEVVPFHRYVPWLEVLSIAIATRGRVRIPLGSVSNMYVLFMCQFITGLYPIVPKALVVLTVPGMVNGFEYRV